MKHRIFTRVEGEGEAKTFVATKFLVDRYGEVVVPKGCEKTLEDYRANPVLHYGHCTSPFWDGPQGSLPIGKATNLRFSEESHEVHGPLELLYDASFANHDFAKVVEGLVEERILNATSIGFRSRLMSKDAVLDGQKGITHLEWDLLENSIVAIPANQGSLRRSLDSSKIASKFKDMLLVPSTKLDDGIYRGETGAAADGHKHSFLVEIRDGRIIMGATSWQDSHFHGVMDPGSTETENDHKHVIVLEAKSMATHNDVVAHGLGLPQEVLNWSKEDVATIKQFLELRRSVREVPEDSQLEELASLMTSIGEKIYNPGEVIKQGIEKARLSHVRGN